MAIIDTGLGWSANSAYLSNTAGELLGAIYRADNTALRQWFKSNSGYAIVAGITRVTPTSWGYWKGMMLISTVPANIECVNYDSRSVSFTYNNLTWYASHGMWDDNRLTLVTYYPQFNTDEDIVLLAKQIIDLAQTDTDPYAEAGTTGTGGAVGASYDFTSTDDIAVPDLPTLSAVNTGFVSIWVPELDQIRDLSNYMWNADVTTIDFWKKLIANPLDLILGLSIVPFDVPATGTDTVTVGLIDTGIEMNYRASQYRDLDCGSIDVLETWGAYLDYDPYTKVEIYLPYCGTHPLKVDDIMDASVNLTYHVDLLTGSCIAMITCTKNNAPLNSVMYQFSGNCASQVPVTASQWADAVRSAISIATSIGSMVASGGGTALQEAGALVENVMNLKPGIERSGSIGSTAGLLAVQRPYLILTRPRQALPESQNSYTGYPSFITETLSNLSGMTYVEEVHLSGIACTDDELAEIESLLKSGVIL